MELKITIDDAKVQEAINFFIEQSKDFSRPLDKIGDLLLSDISSSFSKEKDPWGNSWAALKPITIERRRKKGTCCKKLQDTLSLYNSFNKEAGKMKVEVSTSISYAGFHQNGTSKIPARSFMPLYNNAIVLPSDTAKNLFDILANHYAAST